MGQHAFCDCCSFRFDGGHSHHTGQSECICVACMTVFVCPTKSVWGPQAGEVIALCRISVTGKRRRHKLKIAETGTTFVAERISLGDSGNAATDGVRYPIETVQCPECRAFSLALGFHDGDLCPKCRTGTIRTNFVEY